MAELKPYVVQPWIRPSIEAALDPGEDIEVFVDVFSPIQPEVTRILVLTNRNLRLIGMKPRGSFRRDAKTRPLILNFALPLHTIRGLGISQTPGGLLSQARVTFQIQWSGIPEVWSSVFEPAALLAQRLKERVARETVASEAGGLSAELSRLHELVEAGALDTGEFKRAKTLFLGKPPDRARESAALIQQLYNLYKAGALSEMEFNMKKWDILSKP